MLSNLFLKAEEAAKIAPSSAFYIFFAFLNTCCSSYTIITF